MMPLDKADYVRLARFRHRQRRFLRVSERICQDQGLTPRNTICCCMCAATLRDRKSVV